MLLESRAGGDADLAVRFLKAPSDESGEHTPRRAAGASGIPPVMSAAVCSRCRMRYPRLDGSCRCDEARS